MKTTFVRLFVLALASTGFAASTVVSHSQASHATVSARGQITPQPFPMCPINSGQYCGMH